VPGRQRGFGRFGGAHAQAGVGERAGGDEREEEAPLDAHRVAVAGGAVEHAVEDQKPRPAAGDRDDRAVAAGQVEVAALGAGEHHHHDPQRDQEHRRLDEGHVAEGADVVGVDRAGPAVEALQPVPREQHGQQKGKRGHRGQSLLGLHRLPCVCEPRHAWG
jgi:hypothetical protein